MRVSSTVLAFAITLAGCEGSGTLPSDQGLTPHEFLTQMNEVLCRRVTACAPTKAPLACPFLDLFLPCFERGIDQGLMRYHREHARQCLADLAAVSCDEMSTMGEPAAGLESCLQTLESVPDSGTLNCDGDGGVLPFDGGLSPDDGGVQLPEGPPCRTDEYESVNGCGTESCHECLAAPGGSPIGVCAQPCTVANQDCPEGRTCRPRNKLQYSAIGDCADGYCD